MGPAVRAEPVLPARSGGARSVGVVATGRREPVGGLRGSDIWKVRPSGDVGEGVGAARLVVSVLSLAVVGRARRAEHRLLEHREPLGLIGQDQIVDGAPDVRVVSLHAVGQALDVGLQVGPEVGKPGLGASFDSR